MRHSILATGALILLFLAPVGHSADVYFKVPLAKLEVTEGELPTGQNEYWGAIALRESVVLDKEGEGYVSWFGANGQAGPIDGEADVKCVSIHATKAADVTGRCFLSKPNGLGMVIVKFKIPAAAASPEAKVSFLRAKEQHYEGLLSEGFPGAAWFRHEAREAAAALGEKPKDYGGALPQQSQEELDGSYELFSGGRAVSESLQLDRGLPGANDKGVQTVDVKTIEGIKAAAIDWKQRIKGMSPQLDVLASLVPADQHAVFFPSFAALESLMDEAEGSKIPVVLRSSPQDSLMLERYEHQLGVSMNALTRALGPQLVGSVVMTGSDPYLPEGSDLMVIFESKDPAALEALLPAQINVARQANPEAKQITGQAGETSYSGAETPDHSMRALVARFGNAVALTNSVVQLERVAAVLKGTEDSLAKAPEYTFFRDRYRMGEGDETALLVLSDATIRRWCGPRWRIAESRRIRAAAVLSEMQATWIDGLVRGQIKAGPIYSDLHLTDLGDLSLTPARVMSSTFGSLAMMTPISEIPMETVTQAEADSYKRWRDGYEQNWRAYFDPIAVRFSLSQKKLGADVTVMPLIWGTDYREMVAIAQGVSFAPDAGDPHDALLHLIVAFNHKATMVHMGESFVGNMVPGLKADPFGWLGNSIAVYADDDSFWDELAKAKDPSDFAETNIGRMPIAIRAEVSSGIKLAGFLVALRGFVEQTAPQMTVWENLKYGDESYVKISPSETAKGQTKEIANVAIYYAATGVSLLITPNEALLKRALDREAGRAATTQQAIAPTTRPWLGSSAALRAQARIFDMLMQANREETENYMQSLAWKNIPILNEWKRRYPEEDPVKVHEQIWGTRLLDPAGGQYVWNEKWQTMESSLYGQPGEPKEGPLTDLGWGGFQMGDFGLTFEDQGVRARVELERKTPQ